MTPQPESTIAMALLCLGYLPKPAACRSHAKAHDKAEDDEPPGAKLGPETGPAVISAARRDARRESILDYLTAKGPTPRMDVARALGLSESVCANDLHKLLRCQRVSCYSGVVDGHRAIVYEVLHGV